MDMRVEGRRGIHTKVQGINRTPPTVTHSRRTTKKTLSTVSLDSTKYLPTFAPIQFDSRTEESDNSEGESTRSSAKRGEGSAKRFACPFFKNDPIKYGTQDRRRCASTGWIDMSRLKEHLTRSHTSKTYCPRCYEEFPDLQGLYEHSAGPPEKCEPRPGRPPDGITPDIARKLRSRKKPTPLQSDYDKWVEIYRILFPSRRHIPSPYFEPPQGKVLVHLDGQKEYMRQEVRRLIESRLDLKDGTSDKGELLKIVDECQDEAFNKYRILSGFDFHDDGVYTTSERTPTTQVPRILPEYQALSWNEMGGLQPEYGTTTHRTCTCGSSSGCACGTSAAGGETSRNIYLMPEHNGASMLESEWNITELNTVDWDDMLSFQNP